MGTETQPGWDRPTEDFDASKASPYGEPMDARKQSLVPAIYRNEHLPKLDRVVENDAPSSVAVAGSRLSVPRGIRDTAVPNPLRNGTTSASAALLPRTAKTATFAAEEWRAHRFSRSQKMPPGHPSEKVPKKKRLIVLADGTWRSPESETPTNIVLLAEAIPAEDFLGMQQVVLYNPGLGTRSRFDSLIEAAIGDGIDGDILDMYAFLCMNYDEGDEIYLFGYSRGAYAVRSLAGMISRAGLLHVSKLQFARKAYHLYRTERDSDSHKAAQFRRSFSREAEITLLGAFETVGALGIPFEARTPLLSRFNRSHYEFHDTRLGKNIKNAVHIVSIDEDRKSFVPTLMVPHKDVPNQLTQFYFPGTHGGVGGGNPNEIMLSRNTFHFLIREIRKRELGLDFVKSTFPPSGTVDVPPVPPISSCASKVTRKVGGTKAREIESLDFCHWSSLADRWVMQTEWRPKALEPLADLIEYRLKTERERMLRRVKTGITE